MITSEQALVLITQIADSKNVFDHEIKNFEMESEDWGSCQIGTSIFMFDVTSKGNLRKYKTKPSVRYFRAA